MSECASLDNSLRLALVSAFVPMTEEQTNELFENNGPLSSFFDKIRVGYAVGLYDRQIHDDLHCIRDIRNTFSHTEILMSFDTDEVADACRQLKTLRADTPDDATPGLLYSSAVHQITECLLMVARDNFSKPVWRDKTPIV